MLLFHFFEGYLPDRDGEVVDVVLMDPGGGYVMSRKGVESREIIVFPCGFYC